METIACIHTDLPSKFGVPRQSGLVKDLKGRIVFMPKFRDPEALRGLEDFSHIWLIWEFSRARCEHWSPTVRPPRLGGNIRLGVFATRSPFRPNSMGLSCVRLEKVLLHGEEGPELHVSGIDLMDGTPIFDIKPYVPYADCHPEAKGGFTTTLADVTLEVEFPERWRARFTEDQQAALVGILSRDPRPHYHRDPGRVYGMPFAGYDIRFRVQDGTAEVVEAVKLEA
ncbi:tRNA (N6-threonylcarbamoyladenosine(37)-N6)-methyltransferase TrmO [Mailhella massiliensis]|uniref:tRNA (N6-threonylcarbamoyladenosine(37)-N6)-methyltransferase TrmO n=1 Tax=Mailhella massiliensis TaxID=1903261 RepID=A0A921DS73_9BACT|nr:tRNA (N6-threonylcarbamoyladenosine(37)-N6)-methyltransferase TrmO [Mailhella massiliensis]HJD96647.1 tRNA (N6-threonylcarbamoyladenosine(37)-N6)-methyltransferase TrmO [Mailhella massiliensis]